VADISFDQVLVLLSLGSLLAATLTALGTIRGYRDQLFLQTFTEYTGRYADVLDRLPFEAGRPSAPADLSVFGPQVREEFLKAMRRYFNLCWEELHLYKVKRIDRVTWSIWRAGILETLRSPHFRVAWAELRAEYVGVREFTRFIDDATEWSALPAETEPAAPRNIPPLPVPVISSDARTSNTARSSDS
jgi:hypothetical protein